eukprot:GHRR01009939.1.p1 GENE.GHRR01009939.1~~GHRR01009939.1.p1  ORF type:complete len:537 (+),score=91.15 GHRR01009939.1:293-1903(+)
MPDLRKKPPLTQHMVLSKAELAACGALVAYFLYVLTIDGVRFCQRLVQHNIPVPGLQPGLFGSYVDVSDHQWREFRASIPLLTVVMAGFVACSRLVQATAPQYKVRFYAAFSLIFVAVLHGACLCYILALLSAGYCIAHLTASHQYGLLAVWVWHCSTFVLVRAYEGFPFALFGLSTAALDQHRGMLRWHIYYNLLLLRMISFACDYHWQVKKVPGRLRLQPDTPPSAGQDLRTRSELWQDPKAYNFWMYLAYCLYPPLYIAGPISTYNAFASQMQAPASNLTAVAVGRYCLRALGCWACMELITHKLWFLAVARHKLWYQLASAEGHTLPPLHMCLIPWWVIIIFWLKFTVIWRFFRFWALADGVDVPENMTRCICNNYDIMGFWKNWHASYNQWLVRYMYIPLGGARWRLLNVWVIFTFVAIWHDLEIKLLGWAWLMCLFIAPEVSIKWIGSQPWCIPDKHGRLFRYCAGLAAAVNIVFLIAANMVGFVVGLDGIKPFLVQVLGQPSFLPVVLLACFCGAQLMFALRGYEASRT